MELPHYGILNPKWSVRNGPPSIPKDVYRTNLMGQKFSYLVRAGRKLLGL